MTDRNLRKIRFSHFSTVEYIDPRTDADVQARWYSRQELRRIRSIMATDAKKMRQVISTGHDKHSIKQDVIFQCIGMENFLSVDLVWQSLEHKRRHSDAVRREQDRQKSLKICEDTELRLISKVHNEYSQERAHRVAVGYMNMSEI